MSTYAVILNQFTLYVGSSLFIIGVLGNLLNAGVFYKNNLQYPSTLLLFLASCFNFLYIVFGLLMRILAAGPDSDPTSNNLGWCKTSFFLLQACALISVSSIFYAMIDQYFTSSQHERLRQFSKISTTRKVICMVITFWLLYSIPFIVYTDLIQFSNNTMVCSFSTNLKLYRLIAYFNFPILWFVAPVTVLITFGIVTYRSVSLLKNVQNLGAARLAKQEGCKHFHLLSSQGADPHSLFLYNKVKGQTETALTQLSFERLSIYRPAMLMVQRAEYRPLESFAQTMIRNTVQRVAPEWITTPIEVLARAMCFNAFIKNRSGIETLDNHAIFRLSEQQPFVTKEQSRDTTES